MFCPSCGSEERQVSQFCRACGTDLRAVRATLEKPDAITASAVSARDEIRRAIADRIRELEGYKSGKLTAYQVQELLGLETRMEVDAFLKAHDVPLDMTLEDIKEGRKSLDALLGK